MNSKSSRELLCITGSEKNYALDLKWIAEIYADVHISPFPCLPPHYIGMYNYKGQIIPVISLEAVSYTHLAGDLYLAGTVAGSGNRYIGRNKR